MRGSRNKKQGQQSYAEKCLLLKVSLNFIDNTLHRLVLHTCKSATTLLRIFICMFFLVTMTDHHFTTVWSIETIYCEEDNDIESSGYHHDAVYRIKHDQQSYE